MGKWVLEQEMWDMWHEICTLTPLAPALHLSFVGKLLTQQAWFELSPLKVRDF